MAFLDNIKRFFFKLSINRKLEKQATQHAGMHYDKARRFAFLLEGNDPQIVKAAKQFGEQLKKDNKQVEYLAYYKTPAKKEVPLDIPYFTQKEMTWYKVPKSMPVKKFIKTEFDILINLDQKNSMPLEYISALSKAKCRVGKYFEDKTELYDLMINMSPNAPVNEFIQQTTHYLKMIKPNEQ